MSTIIGYEKVDVEVALKYPAEDRITKVNVGTPDEKEVVLKGGYLQFRVNNIYKSQVQEQAGMLRIETPEGPINFPLYNVLYWTPSKRVEEVKE